MVKNKIKHQKEQPAGANSAILSYIQEEKGAIGSLIKRYGGIKQAATVAVFKAIYREGFEIFIYRDNGVEGGIGVRGRTEHNVEMFHFIDLRKYHNVQSVFAIRDELTELIDAFDINREAEKLLKNEELNKFFDRKIASEELTGWLRKLSDTLVLVSRIISVYRACGLSQVTYKEQEDFTLQDMLNIASKEGVASKEEKHMGGDGASAWDDIEEPEPIPEKPRPKSYTLTSGITLEMEDLEEAAKIYETVREEIALRAKISSDDYAEMIFDYLPQREIDLIIEKLHQIKLTEPALCEDDAMKKAILGWHASTYKQVLDSFYKKYQENFAKRVLSKEELSAGVADQAADVFHSRVMAIRYLSPENYWRWKLVVKERIPQKRSPAPFEGNNDEGHK